MLTALPTLSQNISIRNRVETFVTEEGDTLVIMGYEDARVLLEDVLHYEYSDSLLSVYKERDSLNLKTVALQKEVLMAMGQEKDNLQTIVNNLNQILSNKDVEVGLLKDTIKQQKKEIRKQKFLKIIGFATAIILPIVVLLAVG